MSGLLEARRVTLCAEAEGAATAGGLLRLHTGRAFIETFFRKHGRYIVHM